MRANLSHGNLNQECVRSRSDTHTRDGSYVGTQNARLLTDFGVLCRDCFELERYIIGGFVWVSTNACYTSIQSIGLIHRAILEHFQLGQLQEHRVNACRSCGKRDRRTGSAESAAAEASRSPKSSRAWVASMASC